jgi:hypothetical protein
MEFNKLVFAGLAVGCLAAAAGGSYLAVRQNQAPEVVTTPVNAVPFDSAPENGGVAQGRPAASAPVTESEGVISPEPARPAPAPSRRAPSISSAPSASSRASASGRQPVPSERIRESRGTPAPVEQPTQASNGGNTAPVQSGGTMWEPRAPVQASVPDYKDPEPPPPPPPPAPEFVDLTVPSDAVLGLQIERTVSSELARLEDKVDARVTRDVRVSDRIAIPAGSTVRGSVTEVDKGGRMKGRARLAIRFHTIVLADGTQLALKTDPVVREGQSPGGESAAKVGGAAIGGAILGAILGGGKGAAIGGAVGAGAGTAAAMSNDHNPATLTAGTTVTVRMQAPVTVTVQKE